LQSIWEGHSITQTADLFGVDLRTAESIRNAVKYKFGARNSVQLVRLALEYGMVKV
jgi:DNA-binding CsgD family transcriptional regulator